LTRSNAKHCCQHSDGSADVEAAAVDRHIGAAAWPPIAHDPNDPSDKIWQDGSLPPKPHATLAGPTFEAWLESDDAKATIYGAR
jgi:hypothetical protein